MSINMNKTINDLKEMMAVQCMKTRELNSTYEGRTYYIDYKSIWIDGDGDTFGNCHSENGQFLGQVNLSRFMTIRNEL